ncbi:hypothetical protein PsorP6_011901 [Peronosclerospora sorghi]|uniref:Uncharacterized protein n=1 Tax=Peronosclerospora sorghi TaxID=230839 RepID=A0ACC0WHY9_9STRA|nr:hypothetical protein PsorP6_011901 [Peronosclerospora sorghi]
MNNIRQYSSPTQMPAMLLCKDVGETNGALKTIARNAFMISVNRECFCLSLQSFRLTHVILVLCSCTHTKDVDGLEKALVGRRQKENCVIR